MNTPRKCMLLLSGLSLVAGAAFGAEGFKFERSYGKPPSVGEPRGLAIDSAGNILVTDRGNSRILRVTTEGRLETVSATNPIEHPSAIALGGNGHVYVVDEAQEGVRVFTGRGKESMALVSGSTERSFGKTAPAGVAVDASGNVYVSDQMANRVQKFDSQGKLLFSLGGQRGNTPGAFMGPRGISVDSNGKLYVADEFNNRIQRFSADGKLEAMSDEKSLGATIKGGLGPMSVAVDSKGNMWVAAHTNFAVYKLNPEFNIVVHLEAFGRRDGELAGPIAVAVDSSDNAYVLDNTRRIQKFSPEGNFISKYAFPPAEAGELSAPTGVAADADGNLYVADTANFRIQKFDRTGHPLLAFGRFGQGDGECNGCESIAIDRYGNLFIVDHYNHRVQKFDSNGKFLLKFGKWGSGPGEFIRTKVVATDPEQDFVYVNDWQNNRIQKFDLEGHFVSIIGDNGASTTRPMGPTGLTIDHSGNIYASSWYNNVVQKYDAHGQFVMSIGKQGSGDGEFSGPARLAIDNEGHLVVVDWGNSRVQIFDSNGKFLTKFGTLGSARGQFNQPVGVAVDGAGRLLISDASNARVQSFVSLSALSKKSPQPKSKKNAASRNKVPQRTASFTVPQQAAPAKPYVVVSIFDATDGKEQEFEDALQQSAEKLASDKRLVNLRVLKNIDGLSLQYATYAKFQNLDFAKAYAQQQEQLLRPFCRRDAETHIAAMESAYSMTGVSKTPSGLEYGAGQTGQVAHLGLFLPFPSYREQYQGVLNETKELTLAKKPHGYIGEDVATEVSPLDPARETPYSPHPTEVAQMSFNYGEYETMEDAENSYISRQTTRDPKLVTMERIFYSALQVPTRFYIFKVIGNYGNKAPAALAALTGR